MWELGLPCLLHQAAHVQETKLHRKLGSWAPNLERGRNMGPWIRRVFHAVWQEKWKRGGGGLEGVCSHLSAPTKVWLLKSNSPPNPFLRLGFDPSIGSPAPSSTDCTLSLSNWVSPSLLFLNCFLPFIAHLVSPSFFPIGLVKVWTSSTLKAVDWIRCAASKRNVLIDRLGRSECFGTEVICFRTPGLSRAIEEIRISKDHQWGSWRLYFQAILIYHRYCSTTVSFTTHVLMTYGSMLHDYCPLQSLS